MDKTRFEVNYFQKTGPSTGSGALNSNLIKAKVLEPVEGPTHYKSLFLRILDVEARVIRRNGRLAFQPIYLKQ